MADKNEFRFVVSGVELSEEHRAYIANAIALAGAQALAHLEFAEPVSYVNFIPREWLGRWLQGLDPGVADEVARVTGVAEGLGRAG